MPLQCHWDRAHGRSTCLLANVIFHTALSQHCSCTCYSAASCDIQAEWGASGLPEAGPPGAPPVPLGQGARTFYCLLGHLYAAGRAELMRMASALKLDLPGEACTASSWSVMIEPFSGSSSAHANHTQKCSSSAPVLCTCRTSKTPACCCAARCVRASSVQARTAYVQTHLHSRLSSVCAGARAAELLAQRGHAGSSRARYTLGSFSRRPGVPLCTIRWKLPSRHCLLRVAAIYPAQLASGCPHHHRSVARNQGLHCAFASWTIGGLASDRRPPAAAGSSRAQERAQQDRLVSAHAQIRLGRLAGSAGRAGQGSQRACRPAGPAAAQRRQRIRIQRRRERARCVPTQRAPSYARCESDSESELSVVESEPGVCC